MKKMLVLCGVLMLALPLVAQMGDNMKAGGGVAQAVTQMEQAWASNSKAGNVDAVAANLADSFVELDSDGGLYTKAQIAGPNEGREVADERSQQHQGDRSRKYGNCDRLMARQRYIDR